MTELILYINHSSTDSPLEMSGVDWIAIDSAYDSFIFSDSGSGVTDEADTPTDTELNNSAVQLSDTENVEPNYYFLLDNSVGKLKEIFMAGNKNKRYVFCAEFDGATASEPQFEAWDNDSMNTYLSPALGFGVASESWYRAISTTDALPGEDWVGTPIAGNGASNVLLLNGGNGALLDASNLYFNLKITIPAGYVTPALHTPVFVITWTTN